jgi:hypothetical protein
MQYGCQKITEAIKTLQQMKRDFDTEFQGRIGDTKNSLKQKEVISLEIQKLYISETEAQMILGKEFLGSEAIAAVFGPDTVPTKIPHIPFSREELEQARDLNNQFLILRTDKIPADRLKFSSTKISLEKAPTTRWALVTKDVIPGTIHTNYFDQTEQIIKYLWLQVFKGRKIPKEYLAAIAEYESQKEELILLAASRNEDEWKPAAKRLAALKITLLCRQTRDEALYDLEVYHRINKEYLLPNKWTWTASPDSLGTLFIVGHFDAKSACVSGLGADRTVTSLGGCFSRTI